MREISLSYALQPQQRKIMDATFYYCLSPYACGGQNVCVSFADTMELMKGVNSCLTAKGLISNLGYPTNPSIGLMQ
jgi:hypothetical protein